MANPTFVLIIGADSYRDIDPSGSSDLAGATNDAVAWWRLCRNHLQIDNHHIRICSRSGTGQPLTVDRLTGGDPDLADGVTIKDATRANILAGIRWLGEQVRVHNGAGLVTFSGHGIALKARQLSEEGSTEALAPADITALALDQLITSADYRDQIAASAGAEGSKLHNAEVIDRITNVFDACYGKSLDNQARTLGELNDVSLPPRVLSRLLLSSQVLETSYEIRMNSRWRGAFTHSIQSLMERWDTAVDEPTSVRYLRCSYDNLVFRSREHLNLLGVPQTPTMVARFARTALLPVLRPGNHLAPGETSRVPDAPMKREEYSPGNEGVVVVIKISGTGNVSNTTDNIAVAILPRTNAPTGVYAKDYLDTKEYWNFNKAFIAANNSANTHGFNNWTVTATVYSSWQPDGASITDITTSEGYGQLTEWLINEDWQPMSSPPGNFGLTGNGTWLSGCAGANDASSPTQLFAIQLEWSITDGTVKTLNNFARSGNPILAPTSAGLSNKFTAINNAYNNQNIVNWSIITIDAEAKTT